MAHTPDPANPDDEHDGLFDRLDDIKDRLSEAAIQAEYETGERETSPEEAKSHALVRVARMTLGTIIVIVGIVALPLPGPGWLIIAGGLTILAKDVAWADRLLRYIRKRVPGIPEDGKIPRSSLVTMLLVTLAAVAASLWWTLARGSDDIQAGTYTVTDISNVFDLQMPEGTEFTDIGLEIEMTTTGPITLTAPGCDKVDIAVTARSKTEFTLGQAMGTCEHPMAEDIISLWTDNTVALDYATDGIVNWFFADDTLSDLTVETDDDDFRVSVRSDGTD